MIDLPRIAGVSRALIYGLLSGAYKSASGRQKLSDAIGTSIWPGVTPHRRTTVVLCAEDRRAAETAYRLANESPTGINIELRSANDPQRKSAVGLLDRNGRGVILAGTQFEFHNAKEARDAADELTAELGARRGSVAIKKPVQVSFVTDKSKRNRTSRAQMRKLSATSYE